MDGSATCECQKFKESKLCSHIIAVAGKVGNLATVLAWYTVLNLLILLKQQLVALQRNQEKKPGDSECVVRGLS